jgi:hypothetical protein
MVCSLNKASKLFFEREVCVQESRMTPLTPEEVRHAADEGHVMPWEPQKAPGVPRP